MYINFKKMYCAEISPEGLMCLQMIAQKEESLFEAYEKHLPLFEEKGYIEYLKGGKTIAEKVRITTKGITLLDTICAVNVDDEVILLTNQLMELYENYGRNTGKVLDIQSRVSWFMKTTNFSPEVIHKNVHDYLIQTSDRDTEHVTALYNLFWKPVDVRFPGRYNLRESLLFDIICKAYKLNHNYYLGENQNKLIDWLFQISRLKPPKKGDSEYSLFGDWKKDLEAIERLKKLLFGLLRK